MSQTVSQNHAYLIRRNGIYYFSRRVPSDLQTRFNKERVTISLRTRSFNKAEKSAEALSDCLERYWDGLRLEVFHTKELGLSLVASGKREADERTIAAHMLLEAWRDDAEHQLVDHYHWINNTGCLSVEDIQAIARQVW